MEKKGEDIGGGEGGESNAVAGGSERGGQGERAGRGEGRRNNKMRKMRT